MQFVSVLLWVLSRYSALIFFFKKSNLSTCSLCKHDLWADTMSPAEEKTLSLATDVAGTHRYIYMCWNPLFSTTEYGLMSFEMKTPIDFLIAVALLPDRGNLFFITSWIFDCPVPVLFFVPGEVFSIFDCNASDFSSMLCCFLSVRSCLKLNRRNTWKLLSKFCR